MKEFFVEMPILAWSIVSSMVAVGVIALLWKQVKWWWHNTWYSFPVVGRISRLSGDSNRDITDPSWFKAEKTLCRDYKKFIRIQDEHDFNEKVTYLTKAGDNGRRDTPKAIWILIVALVFVEAMGFAYVLAGFTLPGASENLQQTGAYGIAFLISVILVAFTHAAGHELYTSGKIKFARQEWIESGRKGKTNTGTVPLARQQSLDDDQPGYVHLMNRVGTQPGYILSILTAVIVVVVAIGATYVRGQVLEKQLHQEVTGQGGGNPEQVAKMIKDGLDMSAKRLDQTFKLPTADAAENQRAGDKAREDDISIDRHGGWGTFIILAFIFVFLQILSVFFGFKWGFGGKESKAAFIALGAGRYSTYADVREHYKEIADEAQSKLEHLQQKLMNRNSMSGNSGEHTSKTFYDFMDGERNRETAERGKELDHSEQRGAMEKARASNAVSAQSPGLSTRGSQSLATATTGLPEANPVISILQKLTAMGDNKEAKREFIETFPESLQVRVVQALQEAKELKVEAARQAAQRAAELDKLL